MPAEERSIRDRLAEALWRADIPGRRSISWASVAQIAKDDWQIDADAFMLSILPTVGLVLTKEEDTPTRQDDGGGE